MSERSRTGALLAMLVTVAVLSTGVAGVALADDPSTTDEQSTSQPVAASDGAAVIDKFTERIETLETVEFTRTTETELDDRTTNSTNRIVADLESGQLRTETIDASYGTNTTTVVNETHMVTYNPEENTVNTIEYESQTNTVLPQLTQLANESAVEYEYVGTGTVAGEDVYRLEATPQQTPTDSNASLTVAVDAETYFPVQIETTVQSDRFNVTATQTYSDVSINQDLPDSAFELDVPEDATQPSFEGPEVTSYDQYSALQSGADLSVPNAELPSGYEFDNARTIDGESYYSVSLTYTDGNERLHVNVQEDSPFDWSERDGYESIDLGDETGHYTEHDDYAFLHINTDEQAYTVYGELDEDELADIGTAVLES